MSTPRFQSRWIVGKIVTAVHLNAGSDGRGGTAHSPVIQFHDGSSLEFRTEETESGTYGTLPIYNPPPRTPPVDWGKMVSDAGEARSQSPASLEASATPPASAPPSSSPARAERVSDAGDPDPLHWTRFILREWTDRVAHGHDDGMILSFALDELTALSSAVRAAMEEE